MKKNLLLGLVLFVIIFDNASYSQNIAITDDDAYSVDISAMLDVKSVTKGLLIPRMTTSQRSAIVSPANSLLVYDTDVSAFFFWTGASWSKIGTSENDYWLPDGANIYFTAGNVGVGTSSPGRKMIVKGSSTSLNEAIFAVQNTDGDTVFAVYPEGVRVWVNDDGGSKASGNRGGFAVGGYCPSKAGFTNEYLRVTPDSVRVYIDDEFIGSKASGNRGGFAVGGFAPSKGTNTDHYLFVQDDSTRVYVADSLQGFGVENIEGATDQRIMRLTTENYLVGHQSGINLTGRYNSFYGYKTGTDASMANNNVLIGYMSGTSLTTAGENVFIGYQSGNMNTSGSQNVFIGNNTGFSNQFGESNVFLGNECGYNNVDGVRNVALGDQCLLDNISGCENVMIGFAAGENNLSHANICIGALSGQTNVNGFGNTFIGNHSGTNNSGGESNTFLGAISGTNSEIGSFNVFLGNQSGHQVKGNKNVIIGCEAVGFVNSNPNYSTESVFIGYQSGYNNSWNTTTTFNTFIGTGTGYNCISGSGNVFIGYNAGYNENGSDKLFIDNSNTNNPLVWGDFSTNDIRINGNLCYTGSFGVCSDKRYKKEIVNIPNALETVINLDGIYYNWRISEFPSMNFNEKRQIGVIAQDLEIYFPELVVTDANGYKMVDYSKFSPIFIEAFKEQQKIIELLKEEVMKNKIENSASIEELTEQINYMKSVIEMQTKK